MANEVMVSAYSDITIREDGGLQFAKVGQIQAFAKELETNQMLPKNMTAGQATIAIIFGMKMGIDALAAVQNIAVINGRPAVWGDTCGAIVQSLIEDEYSEEVGEKDEFKVVYTVKRKGRNRPVVREFGYQDAKRAGLWGKAGPWTQYPKRMMLIRARAFAYRDAFPDVLKGIRIAEEEQDAPIDITDTAKVSPAPYNAGSQPAAAEPAKKVGAAKLIESAGAGENAEPAKSVPEQAKEPVKAKPAPKKEATAAAENPNDIFAK